ncbi:MAG: T9SS type A sorting domain-containing protein [Flavobacterium sp.]|uniref:fibronectin type III domain-containing protein n=1 Tax=Flavobacterium sp. TaxID=239 RepID=UPI003263E238
MKKITLLLAFMLAIVTQGYSQVSGYAFSESTEAYTAVVGTTSTAVGDDGIENGIPIGFTFKYDGVDYTHFCVTTNGWIKMGDASTTGTTGTANYSNAFSVTAGNRPLIAPFWDDNNLGSGNIQYIVTGVAPNRILEVGWDNINIGGSGATSTTAFASFKLRLYETTNVIDFVYRPVMAAAGTLTASVGLNGSSSFLSVTPAAASTVSSGTANNAISTTTNLVGKKYTFTPPSCSSPTGINVSVITTTTSTISWTAVVPTPAIGYEYIVSTANTTPVVSGTATTAISVPLSGLLPSTTYYVFVRSNCGSGFSAWSSSVPFTTLCNPITTFPWTENFDALTVGTNVFPPCWSYINTSSNWSISTTPVANSGANSLRRTYGTDGWAFTPLATLTTGISYTLSYYMRTDDTVVGYDLTIGVGNSQTDVAMTTTLSTQTGYQGPTWTKFTHEFTPTTTGDYSFGIQVVANFAPNGINFDNFKLEVTPSCLEPSGLAVSNVTTSMADISWNVAWPVPANGYQYIVSTSNVTPVIAGTAVAGLTASVMGLSANTQYYLFVRSDCGGTFSSWSDPLVFSTPCSSVTSFTENFDSVTAPNFPNCWARVGTGGNTNIQTTNPSSGANTMYIYGFSGSLGVVKTIPVSNLGAGTNRLNFKMRGNFTAGDDVEIGYLTDPNDENTFIALGSVNAASLVYDDYTFTPPVGSYSDYLAFRHAGSIGASVLIDDVVWEPIPACNNPSGLVVSAITETSATVTWTATTGSYEYVLDNTVANPAGSGTVLSGETYNATLLTPTTGYYFHVRTVCAGPTYSTWSTVGFTTLATPPVNDDCSGAITLALAADYATGSIVGTIVGATDSAAEPVPTCASYVGGDVWYKAVVPASGSITFEIGQETGGFTDSGLAVYSGSCGSLGEVNCDDDGGTGAFSLLSLTAADGIIVGETLYARAWRYNNALPKNALAVGQFRIAAYDASLGTQSFDLNGFSAYPNPVKDVLNLSYTKEISNVSVHNLLGQQVMTKSINATQTKIDMSNLSNGTYLVKVTVDGLVKTLKVVKQ